MKRFLIVSLLSLGFLSGSMANPFIGPKTISQIAKNQGSAVVSIQARTITRTPVRGLPFGFFQPRQKLNPGVSEGSGVIVSQSGRILTNAHVIDGARQILVTLSDGRKYAAKPLAMKKELDLAVLEIQDESFQGTLENQFVARLGNSEELSVGEWVIAIGSPYSLEGTVTVGIVSAKGRNLNIGRHANYNNLIQTDASINPGNSGGPLFNLEGEVVGINTAMKPGSQGLGFSIPINLAKRILDDLEEHGEIRDGYLGVIVQNLSPQLQNYLQLNTGKGAFIANVVEDSPASKAGLQRGDLFVSLDGVEVPNKEILVEKLQEKSAGEFVEFEVLRKGKTFKLKAQLASRQKSA